MKQLDTQAQVEAAERTLRLSWVIVFGAVLYSVLTVTPLVQRVTPDRWDWTAPILPIVVDAAVVIVVRIDAIIARLDGRPGGWSAVLRWLTGACTLALNVGDSALAGDLVGVGVHMVAPTLLIVTAEATLTYRRAITAAVARIDRERADERDCERERQARELREREDRARAERQAVQEAEERRREQERADREREREQAAKVAREEREHQALMARQEREHQAAMAQAEREEAARQKREEAERAERIRHEEQERADRERRAREAQEKADRERRAAAQRQRAAAAVSTPRPTVSATAHDAPSGQKMSEEDARKAVAEAVREGRSQRQTATLTGWSTGWIAKRFQELEQVPGQMEMSAA